MRIASIIHMAREYFLLGLFSVSIGISIFLTIYFLIYKKIMKGTKKLKASKILLWSIFLIYTVIVLGATFIHRTPVMHENINLHIFSSYIKVWNRFSLLELRNIIFNILMFLPFGFVLPLLFKKCEKFYITYFLGLCMTISIEVLQLISKRGIFEIDDIINNTLLPLLFKKCEKFYITYFLGLCMTISIEVLQLISKRGIFEIDDIINNTLGCMIGYGVVMIFLLFSKRNKKSLVNKVLIMLCYQIPVIITIISFSAIFNNMAHLSMK